MTLLFVHGLGGEDGGPLECALEREVRGGPHRMLTVRWASGNLREVAGSKLWELTQEAAVEQNPWRLAVSVIVSLQREGNARWDSALAQTTRAAQKLIGATSLLARREEPFAIVGFSLGGRVLMSVLRASGDPGPSMRRVVFVGAAVSGASFAHLSPELLSSGKIVNVFSKSDRVLASLYPYFNGLDGAAGISSVSVSGIRNVEMTAGHLFYGTLAREIVALATN